MLYSRYFKAGQKILLRVLEPPGRFEALTVYFQDGGANHFDLALPYRAQGEEGYPFTPGMALELMSDHLGLGLRLAGHFCERLDESLVRVSIESDLQLFQRRLHRRLDTTVGLRYTKGRGTLRSFREQWEKNLNILEKTRDFSSLPPFPRSQVNLSAGGVRFGIAPPVEMADLCLLLLQLEPNSRPICTLAEVVWQQEQQADGRRSVGMRFISILDADLKRIESFVKERASYSGEEPK